VAPATRAGLLTLVKTDRLRSLDARSLRSARHRKAGSTSTLPGGDQLLLIDIVNAHGVVILQTIWAPADVIRYGRRLTRTERIEHQAQLLDRLNELVGLIGGHLPATTAAAA
jgi:hypothetical protein